LSGDGLSENLCSCDVPLGSMGSDWGSSFLNQTMEENPMIATSQAKAILISHFSDY